MNLAIFKNNFFLQSLVISLSRLIALSLMTLDIVLLSRYGSISQTASFSISSQIIQVFVILSVVLNIGINVILGREKIISEQEMINRFYTYSILLSFILFSLSIAIIPLLGIDSESLKIYVILTISILPLPLFVTLSNILETIESSFEVLLISIISLFANLVLDLYLIKNLSDASIAVSLATVLVRFLILIIAIYFIRKKGLVLKYCFDYNFFKILLSYGRSPAITSLFFTGGLSWFMIFLSKKTIDSEIAILGITLNLMNTLSVFYIGLSITTTIFLSREDKPIKKIISMLKNIIIYICIVFLVMYLLVPSICKVYLKVCSQYELIIFYFGIIIISIDGFSSCIISIERVIGRVKIPPLFRLSFILFLIPMSLFFINENDTALTAVILMVIGSIITLFLCVTYFFYFFIKACRK